MSLARITGFHFVCVRNTKEKEINEFTAYFAMPYKGERLNGKYAFNDKNTDIWRGI